MNPEPSETGPRKFGEDIATPDPEKFAGVGTAVDIG